MLTIYGIKNCDTMKKAFTFLDEHGISYQFHDYKKKGISAEKVSNWLKLKPIDEVVNKKGTTLKKLSEDDKNKINNSTDALEIITQQTSLIKRPLIEFNNQIYLGFNKDVWEKIFV